MAQMTLLLRDAPQSYFYFLGMKRVKGFLDCPKWSRDDEVSLESFWRNLLL